MVGWIAEHKFCHLGIGRCHEELKLVSFMSDRLLVFESKEKVLEFISWNNLYNVTPMEHVWYDDYEMPG